VINWFIYWFNQSIKNQKQMDWRPLASWYVTYTNESKRSHYIIVHDFA